jgi:hypothetical protein
LRRLVEARPVEVGHNLLADELFFNLSEVHGSPPG